MRQTAFLILVTMLFQSHLVAQAKTSLRGSRSALLEQNTVANKEDLSRVKNEREIAKFVKTGLLIRLPDGKYGLRVDPRLERSRRYARPWTVQFLKDLGTRFEGRFRKSLVLNSCIRDVETQEDLRDSNGNAAATKGVTASSHLTGATCDIRRLGLNKTEQDFVRSRLLIHERAGNIEATEEKVQAVWHVMVYKTYTTRRTARAK